MSFLRTLIILIILSVCLGLALNAAAGDKPKFGKISDEEFAMGAPEKYSEANAMVLIDYGEMEIVPQYVQLERIIRIKILTEAGIEEVGEQSIVYDSEYDKIKNFKAHTITPDGKKYDVDGKSKFTKDAGSDFKEMVFTFPKLEVGSIIEYKYTLLSKSHYNLKPWNFQREIYTVKSVYKVTPAAGFNYNVQCQNCPPQCRDPRVEERPDVEHTGFNIRTYIWTAENLPPVTDEPYMAASVNYIAALWFQLLTYESRYSKIKFVEDWDQLGGKAQEWIDGYNNKGKDIAKLAAEIVGDETVPLKKSRLIYSYVMKNYVRILDYKYWYFGDEHIAQLLTEKQGTPESFNLLITLLHRAAGIESWPVLISSRSRGVVNVQNPSLQQFDHMISFVQFANNYVLLDARYKNTPYGILPPNSLVEVGFLIDGEKSQLIKVDMLPAASNRVDLTTIRIDSTGTANCQSQCRMTGYWASYYARRAEARTDEEVVKDYMMGRLNCNYEMAAHEIYLDSSDQFVADVDFTTPDLVETLDNNYILKPVNYDYRTNPFKKEKRFFPVDFQYPFQYVSITNFVVPETMSEVQLPSDTMIEINGARFSRTAAKGDSTVSLTLKLVIDRPTYQPSEYSALRSLFSFIAETSEAEMVVSTAGK